MRVEHGPRVQMPRAWLNGLVVSKEAPKLELQRTRSDR